MRVAESEGSDRYAMKLIIKERQILQWVVKSMSERDLERQESSESFDEVENAVVPWTTAENDEDKKAGQEDYCEELEEYAEEELQLEQILTTGSRSASRIRSRQSGTSVHDEEEEITELRMGKDKALPPMPTVPKKSYVVEFDGAEDPMHPHNWPFAKKFRGCASLGLTTMCVAWGSAIYATAVPEISMTYNVSQVVATLGMSLYIAGFAGGPVIWGSLSELYGRKMPILISQFGFIAFTFGAATAKDIQTIMLCRFFSGFIGSAPFSVVGGAFTDQFSNNYRGLSLICYLSTVFIGPMLAPVAGGFISASYLGWRWTQYITGIMGGAVFILNVFFYEESYHPMVLVKKARMLREQTGNWAIHAIAEERDIEIKEIVRRTVFRPIRILVTQPIVTLIAIYVSFVYGILYLCLEVYPIVFVEGYGFKGGIGELPYIALFLGLLIGGVYLACFEPRYRRLVQKNGGRSVPEARLDAMTVPSICFPIGLFWVTWTGNYPEHIHWIVPTIGGGFIGFALMGIFLSSICYCVESYLTVAASVMAANAFLRSAFAAAFPLFGKQMFHNMGTQWAGTLLGCVAAAMVPIPILFRLYATRLKKTIKLTF